MKILQMSYNNLIGGRFNGRELNRHFRALGHAAQQCVWQKEDADPHVWRLCDSVDSLLPGARDWANHAIDLAEGVLSVNSLLYPWVAQLLFDRRFRESDVVHYHLLSNGYFGLFLLPRLTAMKPSVLTLHDPWMLTGHCVHPYDCQRWKEGCGNCPDLASHYRLHRDTTRFLFRTKRRMLAKSRLDVVVASRFMLEMVQNSPIFENHRVHHIPFGVDAGIFRRLDAATVRNKHGIGEGEFVIAFRGTESEFKGLPHIRKALRRLVQERHRAPVTLLTVEGRGLLEEFRRSFKVVELGIVRDDTVMAEFYNCADLFLMPSAAEAFGMMAIEAMSCGTPVIVFEGTALPGVVFAPQAGVAVPKGDADALFHAIVRLMRDTQERRALGEEAARRAREHYRFDDHAAKVLALYEEVIAARSA